MNLYTNSTRFSGRCVKNFMCLRKRVAEILHEKLPPCASSQRVACGAGPQGLPGLNPLMHKNIPVALAAGVSVLSQKRLLLHQTAAQLLAECASYELRRGGVQSTPRAGLCRVRVGRLVAATAGPIAGPDRTISADTGFLPIRPAILSNERAIGMTMGRRRCGRGGYPMAGEGRYGCGQGEIGHWSG